MTNNIQLLPGRSVDTIIYLRAKRNLYHLRPLEGRRWYRTFRFARKYITYLPTVPVIIVLLSAYLTLKTRWEPSYLLLQSDNYFFKLSKRKHQQRLSWRFIQIEAYIIPNSKNKHSHHCDDLHCIHACTTIIQNPLHNTAVHAEIVTTGTLLS